jgi:anti-sigma28 factor (negative regulator of flagellin synthesis)
VSLRITGQAQLGTIDSSRSTASRSVEADTKSSDAVSETAASPSGSDRAEISNASQFAALAKNLVSADRKEKLAALSARVGSGQYRPVASEVSRTIVQGLLKS